MMITTTFGIFSPTELVILLVIVLILFGPGKLPDLGKSLGRGIKEFKSATEEKEPQKSVVTDDKEKKEENNT